MSDLEASKVGRAEVDEMARLRREHRDMHGLMERAFELRQEAAARSEIAEAAYENAVVLLAREMYVSEDAPHCEDDRQEWDEDVLLATTYETFLNRARAALTTGDSGALPDSQVAPPEEEK